MFQFNGIMWHLRQHHPAERQSFNCLRPNHENIHQTSNIKRQTSTKAFPSPFDALQALLGIPPKSSIKPCIITQPRSPKNSSFSHPPVRPFVPGIPEVPFSRYPRGLSVCLSVYNLFVRIDESSLQSPPNCALVKLILRTPFFFYLICFFGENIGHAAWIPSSPLKSPSYRIVLHRIIPEEIMELWGDENKIKSGPDKAVVDLSCPIDVDSGVHVHSING